MTTLENIFTFWDESGEIVNDEIRDCKIITEKLSYECSENDKSKFIYYINYLLAINDFLKENVLTENKIFYRTMFKNIFRNYKNGDIYECKTLLTCFVDDYNFEYGNIKIEVECFEGTNFIQNENTVILPRGNYQVYNIGKHSYRIRLIQTFSMFDS